VAADGAAHAAARVSLRGVDFSSAPTRRKPIVLALGELRPADPATGQRDVVRLLGLRRLDTLAAYAACLADPGPWVGAFDFPFSLPRELVQQLGWPTDWPALIRHYRQLSRAEIRACFAAFCAARPAGGKFAHRACDLPAGASPSMKWVNPPVAYMLHVGVPPLIDAGCHLPGLLAGDLDRVALEAYPGLLAREQLGRRSYKGDQPAARHDPARRAAREALLDALLAGRTRLRLSLALVDAALRELLLADASGDSLDATLCLLQAGWAALRRGSDYGLPADLDPLEGWIVSA
jgi:hypothetical protein